MHFNNESIVEALTPFEPGFRKKTRENKRPYLKSCQRVTCKNVSRETFYPIFHMFHSFLPSRFISFLISFLVSFFLSV